MTIKLSDQAEGFSSGFSAHAGYSRLALWGVVALACALVGVVLVWPEFAATFNQEGGPIETLSAAGLFVAGLAALWRYRGISRAYIGLTCLLLAERELEADIYSEGSLPFTILHGLDVFLDVTWVRVALVTLVLGGAVWHGIPTGWRAFKQRNLSLMVFIAAGSAAVIAQLLEEFSGLYAGALSDLMMVRLFVLEETLEMFFSIGILVAVLIGWPKTQSNGTHDDQDSQSIADIR
ncbi:MULTISPECIES: hypothetical protein [unclassified Ruegeria]|uniref:hypothetical protein n=1 Tax=unclassified Ruegeria TaxID=2625375 RepID=UPI001488265F|nr:MULTISPECIES: hypothetical protein [unclassified Ruegeria]NOD62757.1 hypothetical protein [Ruegeria sp. HKCCD6109]